jgi:acyl-CoA reductase-like NAD-dependent aldehyde dehydrogenase
MIELISHIINGLNYSDPNEPLIRLKRPIDQQEYLEFPSASKSTVESAIESSANFYKIWSRSPLVHRSEVLLKAAHKARQNINIISEKHAEETGKSISSSQAEISAALDQFEKYSNLATEFFTPKENATGSTRFRPYGPTVLIVPWNYPIVIAFRTLPALLISGNTVIWKPSEKTPNSAFWMLKYLELPAGLVNLVLGSGEAGAGLVSDPRTKLVVHTGSTKSGRLIAAKCGELLKPCILELGGKDAMILDSKVEVSLIATKIARASFENSGQICTSIEKVYVPDEIKSALIQALILEIEQWSLGEHDYELKMIGPMIDLNQVENVSRQVTEAVTLGAKCLAGGVFGGDFNNYFMPTLLCDVPPEAAINSDETFGPVIAISTYSSRADLVKYLNSDEYGLAATVVSDDPEFLSIVEEINTAIIWKNDWHSSVDDSTFEPFGNSGLGKIGPGKATLRAVNRAVHTSELLNRY